MSYLCKNCTYNNNGWCNKLKKQGLKQITECNDFTTQDSNKDHSLRDEQMRTLGKVEMLYFLHKLVFGTSDLNVIRNQFNCQVESLKFSVDLFRINEVLESSLDQELLKAFQQINQVEKGESPFY